MEPQQTQPPFEVYCSQCRVSFPIGTKKCIHCGSPLGRRGPARAAGVPRRLSGAPPPPVLDESEEDLPMRSGVMSPVAILWIALILGGAIYRTCS